MDILIAVCSGFVEFNLANHKIDINQYDKFKKLYKKYK